MPSRTTGFSDGGATGARVGVGAVAKVMLIGAAADAPDAARIAFFGDGHRVGRVRREVIRRRDHQVVPLPGVGDLGRRLDVDARLNCRVIHRLVERDL